MGIEGDLYKSNTKSITPDKAAFTILTLNFKYLQIMHIQACTTTKEAWEVLRIVYHRIGESARMVLSQRVRAITMVEGNDMPGHLNNFN